MRALRFARFWQSASAVLIVLALFYLLSPGGRGLGLLPYDDKVHHFVGFFGLTLWFCGLYPRSRHGWLLIGMILFGALTELLQIVIDNGRVGEIADLAADIVGIVAALVVASLGADRWCSFFEQRVLRV